MLKARAGDTIFLGLSDENVKRLKAGKPMVFDLKAIGLPNRVVIFHGATEEIMETQLDSIINKR